MSQEKITKAWQPPPIPVKRFFTVGEVSELCAVKSHILRYWEQEFTQLNPTKRRGDRRMYQHHEVLLIRRVRELLYEEGLTISGVKRRLGGSDVFEPIDTEVHWRSRSRVADSSSTDE